MLGDGTAATVRSAVSSSFASSTALVISSTNSGTPSVRLIMPPYICWKHLVADDAVDHRTDFALSQSIDSEGRHIGAPNPGRLKFGPERHDQQHAKAWYPVHDATEGFELRWVGPMCVLEDHQQRILARQRHDL